MRRHIKYQSITAWILVISFFVSLNTFFINVNSKEMFSDEGYNNFILEEELNYCSDLSGLYEECYFTQGFNIINSLSQHNSIRFLIGDNSVAGILLTYYADNNYQSVFYENDFSFIKDIVMNYPISLVYLDDVVYLCSGQIVIPIIGKNENDETSIQDINEHIYLFQQQEEAMMIQEENRINVSSLSSNDSMALNVTWVQNSGPNCWAACVSMISAFRLGNYPDSTSYLVSALQNLYNSTPSGTNTWIQRGFNYYGVSVNHFESGMEYYTTKNTILSYRPIYAGIHTDLAGHAVVISGFLESGGSYYYRLKDPNVSGTALVHVYTGVSHFTYTSLGTTFIYWRRTYY